MTVVDAPGRVAFAGPMGTSAARWGMDLKPIDERQTDAMIWIGVDLGGILRRIPPAYSKAGSSASAISRWQR